MNKFKREITIVIEGETSEESLSNEELFKKLSINPICWWVNSNWPYGKPCKEMIGTEITKIELKT